MHLSLNVVNPIHLIDVLLRTQVDLPNILRLPVDPVREEYYKSLWCTTLISKDEIVALVPLLFLDGENSFKVFKVVDLSVPCSGKWGKSWAVAKYKLGVNNMAINLAGIKFKQSEPWKALTSGANVSKVCSMKSPIYTYKTCVKELFKGQVDTISLVCQIDVMTEVLTPCSVDIWWNMGNSFQ